MTGVGVPRLPPRFPIEIFDFDDLEVWVRGRDRDALMQHAIKKLERRNAQVRGTMDKHSAGFSHFATNPERTCV